MGKMKRKLIQLYTAVLYNASVKGFVKGGIFTGAGKGLCVPGLNCYSCPGAIASCPLGAMQNALAASGKRAPFYVFGILALYGIIFGRMICGWLCPVGLIQELVHRIPTPKIRKSRVTRGLSWLKYLSLIYFAVAIPLASIRDGVAVPGFCKYICPAGTIEGAVPFLANSAGTGSTVALGGLFGWKCVIAVALVTLAVFMYRAFCRFICPLGAIYSLFSRFALMGVKVDAAKCTDCGACVAKCKMDIKRVGDRECIQCGECMDECPTKAITWKNGKVSLKENEIAAPREKGKRKIANVLLVILAAAALLWAVWYGNFSADAQTPVKMNVELGTLCPDFEVPLCADEGSVTLQDCLGKPTVINFWATWCGGCVTEMPAFQQLWEKYGEQVNVVAVHSAEVTDPIGDFIRDAGYTFHFALDEENRMIPALGGSTALPQTVVLDREGRIVYNRIGSVNGETLEELILPLLAGEAPWTLPVNAESPENMATYTIRLTDGDGQGVAGAKLQVCTDTLCRLMTTDENGQVTFTDAPYAYEVEILKLPAGYTADTAKKETLKPEGDTLIWTVDRDGSAGELTESLW